MNNEGIQRTINSKRRKEAERAAFKIREQYQVKKKLESEKKHKLIAEKSQCWNEQILPRWKELTGTKQVGDMCMKGIPPNIRGKVWPLLIGNDLKVSGDLLQNLIALAELSYHDGEYDAASINYGDLSLLEKPEKDHIRENLEVEVEVEEESPNREGTFDEQSDEEAVNSNGSPMFRRDRRPLSFLVDAGLVQGSPMPTPNNNTSNNNIINNDSEVNHMDDVRIRLSSAADDADDADDADCDAAASPQDGVLLAANSSVITVVNQSAAVCALHELEERLSNASIGLDIGSSTPSSSPYCSPRLDDHTEPVILKKVDDVIEWQQLTIQRTEVTTSTKGEVIEESTSVSISHTVRFSPADHSDPANANGSTSKPSEDCREDSVGSPSTASQSPPQKRRSSLKSKSSFGDVLAPEEADLADSPPHVHRVAKEAYTPDTNSRRYTINLIEHDIPRTFPTLAFFHDGGPLHMGLVRVLKAFACYRPDIGYVQGMSYIASMLLLYMDELEAFQCLANLLSRRGNMDFYRLKRHAIENYVRCFDFFFKQYLPLLYMHMRGEGLTSEMYLMDWNLSLFSKALPLEVAARIWDVYLFEGEVFVMRAALGILRMYAPKLCTQSMEEIMTFLINLPPNINADVLLENIDQIRISKRRYETTRNKLAVEETKVKNEARPTHSHNSSSFRDFKRAMKKAFLGSSSGTSRSSVDLYKMGNPTSVGDADAADCAVLREEHRIESTGEKGSLKFASISTNSSKDGDGEGEESITVTKRYSFSSPNNQAVMVNTKTTRHSISTSNLSQQNGGDLLTAASSSSRRGSAPTIIATTVAEELSIQKRTRSGSGGASAKANPPTANNAKPQSDCTIA